MNEQTATVAELKPCPFCGKQPEVTQTNSGRTYFVECKNNHCESVVYTGGSTLKEAAEKWNKRAGQHGRWELTEKAWMHFYKCSACKMLYKDNPNYCPRCGAKMDGGETDAG